MNLIDQRIREYFGRRFSDLLKKWMSENHKTQKDFCSAAGVSTNIVTAWKRGERLPRDSQMMKICKVLEIDPRTLNVNENEPRLLTPDELRALPRLAIVWIEYYDGELQKSCEEIVAAFKCKDGHFVDEVMCYYVDFEKDMLPDPDGSCWRFWSAEPSAELRKATPWM